MIDLTTFINKEFNESKAVACIYIDLAKGFNSLDCTILVQKLHILGFEGNFYLKGRFQSIKFSGILSDKGYLGYGVPQDSTLGPTLLRVK